jgi:hypothetical protein
MTPDLAGQEISQVCVDYGVLLRTADGGELRIESNFYVSNRASRSLINPQQLCESASMVVGLLRQRIMSAVIDAQGRLLLDLLNGARVECEPSSDFEAWTLTTPAGEQFVSLPGGQVARWSGQSSE